MAEIKKAGMMRKTIAINMQKSWNTAPKCDYYTQIDAEPLMQFRERHRDGQGGKLSYLTLVMLAAAKALREHPQVNATYFSADNTYALHEHVNVGFAMNVPNGLLVLCTHDTDQMSAWQLNGETGRLIQKAREQKAAMDDVSGSTFTVNNMGGYKRLMYHSAIINQPESAILSFYSVGQRPVVRRGELAVGWGMNIALSADHRLIDGGLACAFLSRVCEMLEEPESLLENGGQA